MYKPINFHSGLFSELRYMSNGLTFEILNGISRNFQGCCQMTIATMVAKFRDNPLRIDWLDTEKLTFILDHPPPSDRL